MRFGENEYVVHVDCYYSAVNEWLEYVVHEILECGWRIRKTEKHYGRFKESEVCAECGFPFVAFFDTNIIISPSYVHFREYFGVLNVIDEIADERKWIAIFYCSIVKLLVVLSRA